MQLMHLPTKKHALNLKCMGECDIDCYKLLLNKFKIQIILSNQCSYCHFINQTQFRNHSQTFNDFQSSALSSTYSRGCTQVLLLLVFTFTALTRQSSPGYALTPRPRGHSILLALGSTISTTTPFFKLCLHQTISQ